MVTKHVRCLLMIRPHTVFSRLAESAPWIAQFATLVQTVCWSWQPQADTEAFHPKSSLLSLAKHLTVFEVFPF